MKAPPLLPEETLHRVLRLANFDGWSVLGIAGALALVSAAAGDFFGAAVGLLVAAAGAIELHGAGLLRAGDGRGMKWVLASQPYLLTVILGYCAMCLWTFDAVQMRATVAEAVRSAGVERAQIDAWRATVAESGQTELGFLRELYVTTYLAVALATLVYQGRMTFYYYKRRAAVAAALAAENEPGDFN